MDWELEYDAIERGVRAVLDEKGRAMLKAPQVFMGCFNDLTPEHKDEAAALQTFFDAELGASLYAVLGASAEEQTRWLNAALRSLTASGMAKPDAVKLLKAVGKGAGLKPKTQKNSSSRPKQEQVKNAAGTAGQRGANAAQNTAQNGAASAYGTSTGIGFGQAAAGLDAASYLARLAACVKPRTSEKNSVLLKNGTRLWLPKNNTELKNLADFIGYPEINLRNQTFGVPILLLLLGVSGTIAGTLGPVLFAIVGILLCVFVVCYIVQVKRFAEFKRTLAGFIWEIDDTGEVDLEADYNAWQAHYLGSYAYYKGTRAGSVK